MVLESLTNLRSFYSNMKNTSTTEANNSNPSRPLFCEKVAFPALEGLTIEFLGNISGIIGDKQLKLPVQQEENKSFWNLPRLRHLSIAYCSKLKAIVVANKEGAAHDKPLIFRDLHFLYLSALKNLKSFYSICGSKAEEEISKPQLLFNEKVAFPALEELIINGVKNISGIIRDKQLKLPVQQEENESFWNLPRLRDLRIGSCSKLKAIVVANKEGGAHDKPLIFRDLHSLYLSGLDNLKSFYSICGSKAKEEISKPQPLFNEKVVFPWLKELTIWGLDNIKQIWISTLPTNSFNRLTSLSVAGCEELLYVAPSELLRSFQNLQSLEIKYCESIEEIVTTRESNAGKGILSRDESTSEQVEIILMPPQLERVSLKKLPRLISFCSGYKLPPLVQLSIQECPSFRPLI